MEIEYWDRGTWITWKCTINDFMHPKLMNSSFEDQEFKNPSYESWTWGTRSLECRIKEKNEKESDILNKTSKEAICQGLARSRQTSDWGLWRWTTIQKVMLGRIKSPRVQWMDSSLMVARRRTGRQSRGLCWAKREFLAYNERSPWGL